MVTNSAFNMLLADMFTANFFNSGYILNDHNAEWILTQLMISSYESRTDPSTKEEGTCYAAK